MSGECDKCNEHALECTCRQFRCTHRNGLHVSVNSEILLELVFWARRYCDGRSTYAPTRFNWIYKYLKSQYPDIMTNKDEFDHTLKDKGKYWPFAQDGMYEEKTGRYDARK